MKEEYTHERLQEWSKSDLIWLALEKKIAVHEDKLHNTALYYMDCMRQKHESITHEPLSLDEFLNENSLVLTMQDLYLGQSIINLFDL